MVKVGGKAPAFTLKDKDGKAYALKDIPGAFRILYFYPKDDTPGCTIEAKAFSKDLDKFKKLGATIVGISGGDEKTKTKFCKKYDLNILLLSDTDFKVSDAYGQYGEKSFMGRKYMGISRTINNVQRSHNSCVACAKGQN